MSADRIFAVIASWASEDTRRGLLAREFLANEGDDPKTQAARLFRLTMYFDREATRIRRDRLEESALAAA